ncbi:MAG: 50S ribosomal protein L17 [Thermodesulfobacteriota bacterium]
MRHRRTVAKLGKSASHRRAMLRNMVTSLFEHERIITTTVKAKAAKPIADRLITLAKRGDLHARRQAMIVLKDVAVARKLFTEIKDRFLERSGGYTSLVKIGPRRGDAAEMAALTLINPEILAKAKKKSKKKPAKKKETQQKKEAGAKAKAESPAKIESAPAIPAEAEEKKE